jgi:hypothetical protein
MDGGLQFALPLPNLGSAACYQLIHLGSLAYGPALEQSITGYFQPWHNQAFLTSSLLPVERQIAIHHAAILVPGSLWDAQGMRHTEDCLPPAEYRVWFTGAHPLHVARLRDIIEPACLCPSSFWATQGETWVAVVDYKGEQLLIPCFELLRAFYYHAGARIIRHCFSQLPWDLLCRPHSAPTAATGYQAQIYVAARFLTESEACVLGGLLFDPMFLQSLTRAQASWTSARSVSGRASVTSNYAKTTGHLDRDVLLRIEGHAFVHKQRSYFWVSSLTQMSSPYSFQKLLYHGLESCNFPSQEPASFPVCSDLLAHKQPRVYDSQPKPTHLTTRFTPYKEKVELLPAQQAALAIASSPSIARGATWARQVHRFKPLTWLNNIPSPHKEDTAIIPEINQKDIKLLETLLQGFISSNQLVTMLTLNNNLGYFGSGLSVLPHQGTAPLPGLPYRHRIRLFHLAQVDLDDGILFLLYFHHLPDAFLLCQRRDLNPISESEWTQILDIVANTKSVAELRTLRKRCRHLEWSDLEPHTGLIVRSIPATAASISLCQNFVAQLLKGFRRQLALQVSLHYRYPGGISAMQQRRLLKLMSKHKSFDSSLANWDRYTDALWKFQYPEGNVFYKNEYLYKIYLSKLSA